MPWVGLQCVIVVFPDHTHLLLFVFEAGRMRFLGSHDTLSLFLHDIMTCMHISKAYNEKSRGKINTNYKKA